MAEWKEWNDEAQRAMVAAGYKGGQYFEKPVVVPSRHFVNALSTESQVAQGYQGQSQGNVEDPWYGNRRNK